MNPDALNGGFTDAPVQASHAFRTALNALSRPGQIETLHGASAPAPLSTAAATLAVTLFDATTPVHLAGAHDTAALRAWITFHTGAPLVDAGAASFAIGTWAALQPIQRFAIGLPDYPDRAATLIVEMPTMAKVGARLTGPGIETEAFLSLPETAAFKANRAIFPLGFDCFFTAGAQVAGLPRSTIVGDI